MTCQIKTHIADADWVQAHEVWAEYRLKRLPAAPNGSDGQRSVIVLNVLRRP